MCVCVCVCVCVCLCICACTVYCVNMVWCTNELLCHLHRYHNETAKCRLKLQEAVKKWRTGGVGLARVAKRSGTHSVYRCLTYGC